MQYEAYEKKIKKVASFLALILRHIVLVIAVLLLIVGSIAALLVFKGTVFSVDCPESVAYGEEIACEGKAFLSSVSFEFFGDDGSWSETAPVMPGDYKVRACAKGSFGSTKYGEELALRITSAKLAVSVEEDAITYGEVPTPYGDTVGTDRIECTQFTYGDYRANTSIDVTHVQDSDDYEQDVDGYPVSTPIQPRNGNKEESLPDGVSGVVEITPDTSSIKIFNEDGVDVTQAYDIEAESKEVGIIPRKITVTVEDREKTYDGIALTWDVYELTEGELVGNDTMMATFYTSITEVGKEDNAPLLLIKNGKGDIVNFCYDVTMVKGTLSVNARLLYITSGSDEFVYDGIEHTCDTYYIEDHAEDDGLLEGHTLKLVESSSVKDVTDEPVLNDMLFSITDSEGKRIDNNYSILLGSGTLQVTPKDYEVSFSDASLEYDGQTHYYGLRYRFDAGRGRMEAISWPNYQGLKCTDVGVYSTEDAPVIICDLSGEDITHNFNINVKQHGKITITPRKLAVSTSDYAVEYSGGKDYPDWEATLNVNGALPSRHTVKASIADPESRIDVGEYENAAKVKIFDSSNKDVSHNYEIIEQGWGSFEIYERLVAVILVDAQKVYDDTPLMADKYHTNRLVSGHTLKGEITGSITEVKENGTVMSSLKKESIVITDEAGNDVTHNYSVAVIGGMLTIEPLPITVTTLSGTHEYDAEPFTKHEIYESVYESLLSGHTLEYTFDTGSYVTEIPKGEEKGIAVNALNIDKTKIIRTRDNKEVQGNYDITYVFGTLTLTKRAITVTSHSNTWEYDGEEHYERGFDVTTGTLVTAHGHKINTADIISETVIDAGKYDNYFYDIIIRNSRNVDVSHNYQISRDNGTLEITPKDIIVVTDSASKQYDGFPLRAPNATSNGLLPGHEILLEQSKTITNVSESGSENTFGNLIIVSDGQNVTKNYNVVEYEYGKLTVTRCPITVITGSDKRIYNGKAMSNDRGEIDPYVNGAYAKLYGNTQHTGTGEVENRCDTTRTKILDASGNDITDNFTIKGYIWGTLNAVEGDIIKVAVSPKTKIYTGSEISIPITQFDLEILSPGSYSINYGGLSISGENCGAYTLGMLNSLAEDYNIRVTALDGSGSGKVYKVIFVTPEGEEDNSYSVLNIAQRAITLTAASATCVYKENAQLTCNDADITKGSLASGHTIEFICQGSIFCDDSVYEGYTAVNRIEHCQIFDKYGNDVSYNYDVTCYDGILTLIMDDN